MKQITDQDIQEMVDTLVQELQPEMVLVFGSQARGVAGPESDVDLLVVEGADFGPNHPRWSELKRIRRALSGFRFPKDILLFSQREFDYWKEAPSHVISRALLEGRLLYARS